VVVAVEAEVAAVVAVAAAEAAAVVVAADPAPGPQHRRAVFRVVAG